MAEPHTGAVVRIQAVKDRLGDLEDIAGELEVDHSQAGEVRNLDTWVEADIVAAEADRNSFCSFEKGPMALLAEEKAL